MIRSATRFIFSLILVIPIYSFFIGIIQFAIYKIGKWQIDFTNNWFSPKNNFPILFISVVLIFLFVVMLLWLTGKTVYLVSSVFKFLTVSFLPSTRAGTILIAVLSVIIGSFIIHLCWLIPINPTIPAIVTKIQMLAYIMVVVYSCVSLFISSLDKN